MLDKLRNMPHEKLKDIATLCSGMAMLVAIVIIGGSLPAPSGGLGAATATFGSAQLTLNSAASSVYTGFGTTLTWSTSGVSTQTGTGTYCFNNGTLCGNTLQTGLPLLSSGGKANTFTMLDGGSYYVMAPYGVAPYVYKWSTSNKCWGDAAGNCGTAQQQLTSPAQNTNITNAQHITIGSSDYLVLSMWHSSYTSEVYKWQTTGTGCPSGGGFGNGTACGTPVQTGLPYAYDLTAYTGTDGAAYLALVQQNNSPGYLYKWNASSNGGLGCFANAAGTCGTAAAYYQTFYASNVTSVSHLVISGTDYLAVGASGTFTGANYSNLYKWMTTAPNMEASGAVGSNNAAGYSMFDRSWQVDNGKTVTAIGVYSNGSQPVTVKIAKRNSSGNYSIVVSQTCTTLAGGGWTYCPITPYAVPNDGGEYDAGVYSAANIGVTSASVARAYKSGDITGSSQTGFTENSSNTVDMQVIYTGSVSITPCFGNGVVCSTSSVANAAQGWGAVNTKDYEVFAAQNGSTYLMTAGGSSNMEVWMPSANNGLGCFGDGTTCSTVLQSFTGGAGNFSYFTYAGSEFLLASYTSGTSLYKWTSSGTGCPSGGGWGDGGSSCITYWDDGQSSGSYVTTYGSTAAGVHKWSEVFSAGGNTYVNTPATSGSSAAYLFSSQPCFGNQTNCGLPLMSVLNGYKVSDWNVVTPDTDTYLLGSARTPSSPFTPAGTELFKFMPSGSVYGTVTGRLSGGLASVAGKIAQGISFTGTNDSMSLSSAVALPNPAVSTGWTIATWFQYPLAAATGGYNAIGRTNGSGGGDLPIVVRTSDKMLGTYSADSDGNYSFQSSGYNLASLTSTWHHLVGESYYDGNNTWVKFYIDGAYVGMARNASGNALVTAANDTVGGKQFGTLDDFRIYNRQLTPAEISTLYGLGNVTSGLTAYWTFDSADTVGIKAYNEANPVSSACLGDGTACADSASNNYAQAITGGTPTGYVSSATAAQGTFAAITNDNGANIYKWMTSATGASSVEPNTNNNYGGYTTLDRSWQISNGSTVTKIGFYSSSAISNAVLKIMQRTAAGAYTVVGSMTVNHPGGGWADFTLPTPYAIPATGAFYAGIYYPSGSIGNNSGNYPRAYIATNVTTSSASFNEDGSGAASLRVTYQSPVTVKCFGSGTVCGSPYQTIPISLLQQSKFATLNSTLYLIFGWSTEPGDGYIKLFKWQASGAGCPSGGGFGNGTTCGSVYQDINVAGADDPNTIDLFSQGGNTYIWASNNDEGDSGNIIYQWMPAGNAGNGAGCFGSGSTCSSKYASWTPGNEHQQDLISYTINGRLYATGVTDGTGNHFGATALWTTGGIGCPAGGAWGNGVNCGISYPYQNTASNSQYGLSFAQSGSEYFLTIPVTGVPNIYRWTAYTASNGCPAYGGWGNGTTCGMGYPFFTPPATGGAVKFFSLLGQAYGLINTSLYQFVASTNGSSPCSVTDNNGNTLGTGGSGSVFTGPINSDTTYTLSCTGVGSVPVTVTAHTPAPAATFTVTPSILKTSVDTANAVWTSTDVATGSCGLIATSTSGTVSVLSAIGAGDARNFTTPTFSPQGKYNLNLSCATPYILGATGNLNATPTTGDPGKIGSAYTFDGATQSVTVPNPPVITNAITVSAWVKLTNPANDQKVVNILHTPTPYSGYILAVGNSKLYPEIWIAGSTASFQSGTVPTNTWTLLTMTWQSGGNLVGYINGVQVNSVAGPTGSIGSVANSPNPLAIGQASWGPGLYVGGGIDDVRIYNRALSASEVAALYNSGQVSYGLVGYWPLDDASGAPPVTYDMAGGMLNKFKSIIVTDDPTLSPPLPNSTAPQSISVSPARVKKNTRTTITWSVPNTGGNSVYGFTCNISSNPSSGLDAPAPSFDGSGASWSGSVQSGLIQSATTFTLRCASPNGVNTTSATVNVNLIPDVKEI